MITHRIDFEKTGRFTKVFLDYINGKPDLKPFYNLPPAIGSFEPAMKKRTFSHEKRAILANVLARQYGEGSRHKKVLDNIAVLRDENTFTVTTGHQLNLCTGPLYFIYKILAVIKMTEKLARLHPAHRFVPVYWMAGEDHDFAEISHFNLWGKKIEWQLDARGPVGLLETKGLEALFEDIPDLPDFIRKAYLESTNLAAATRRLVDDLFGKYGLVVMDADDKALKMQFREVMRDDLFSHTVYGLVSDTSAELKAAGYKNQVYTRPVNLFYMEKGLRERIVEDGGVFRVLNTEMTFSGDEMMSLLDNSPEKLSPNVVLRPLYQEFILPNLAYVGGPAEIAYWLQLKSVFDHYKTPFPILFPRLFAMIIPRAVRKKMLKLHITESDLFHDFQVLKEKILYDDGLPANDLSQEMKILDKAFNLVKQKATEIDKSLEGYVVAEQKKAEKGMLNIQKRLKKAIEQKEATKIKQLESVMEKLFPEGNLQERHDNFLNFYINNPLLISELHDALDPYKLKFNILTEDA